MQKESEDTDIIERLIGQLGKWQITACISIFLVKFSVAWHQLGTVFLAPPATFNCSNIAYTKCDSQCPSHDFDKSIFQQTIITQWDLVCERAHYANLAQTIFMFGILIGNVVFGFFSDRYGRRNPLIVAVVLQVIAGVAAAFAPDLWVFITLRFFCGMATGGTMLTSFVLVMEIVGKKYRTILGVLFQIPFNIGHASLGLFGYFLRDWHHFQLAISIPSIILISYYWLVPESPRWLLTVGRTDDSVKVMTKAAKVNRLPTYTIQEKVTAYLEDTKSTQQSGGNVLDLVKTKEMRIRTICIFINWIIIGLVFYGVAQFMGQISGNIFINVAISGLVQVPGNILGIYLMDTIGRKWTLVCSYGLCVISCLIITVVPEDPAWATTILGCVGQMAIAVSFSIIYVYSGELYPTTVRNVGMGSASMFARFGSMIAPFVTSFSGDDKRWVAPLIFGLLPFIAIIVSLRLPETLNHKLPDTIEEAEMVGKNNNIPIKGVANQAFSGS